MSDTPTGTLLDVSGLRIRFASRDGMFGQRHLDAVNGVDMRVAPGETVGLVGESGSGKSTLARGIARLVPAAAGSVQLRGEDWLSLPAARLREQRRHLQLVFQDPLASLNPRLNIGQTLEEPLRIFEPSMPAAARHAAVSQMLLDVGLEPDDARRYPRQFSGGQCQRIGIARAMLLRPSLLICDEAVSALDVSIQGQIVNLLLDLQRSAGTAMIFISHNLGVVRHVSRRVYVLFRGRIVEEAPSDELFAAPRHPYTRELLAAIPHFGPGSSPLRPASPAVTGAGAAAEIPLEGCAYRLRCPHAAPPCATLSPALLPAGTGRQAACLRVDEI
jgi:oligopeptide transport system ATP-binding protein